MKGSEWLAKLPAKACVEREKAIIDAVASQTRIVHDWFPLTLTHRGHKIVIGVSRDVLRVGEPSDSVRVSVTGRTQAAIANIMGARLLTPKLADIIHCEATTVVPPLTRQWFADGTMALTRRMAEQSRDVDAMVGRAGGLVSGQCKDWVLCKAMSPSRAANYGWHTKANGQRAVTIGLRVWQSVGTAHNWDHTDYSQHCRLVSRELKVDGQHMDLDDMLRDPELAGAISHEGTLSTVDPVELIESGVTAALRDTDPAPPPKPSSRTMPAVKTGDVEGVPLIQARNYTSANRMLVDVVVLHSMEAGEHKSTAENVARWFAGASAPRASAHYCVDSDSIVQCVRERDVAWHAPGANGNGIGIEHAGYAKQTEAQWLDDYGHDMLLRSAELAAGICKRWRIPVVRLTVEELKAGRRGLCGHHDVSLAFKKSTHTDPGRGFPWAWYLEQVRRIHDG